MSGVSPATFTPQYPIKRGQDWSFVAEFKQPNGTALSLSGWTVEAQVWDVNRTSKVADLGVSFPSGITSGVVKFALTKLQTPSLLNDNYYDVALTDTALIKEYYLEGILNAEEGYTR